jgi:hypothetical protein
MNKTETLVFTDVNKFLKVLRKAERMPIGFNRPTTDSHIAKMKISVIDNGILRMINLVQTDMFGKKDGLYILDGQHLVAAILDLPKDRLSGHFVIAIDVMDNKKAMIHKMASLNSISKGWTLEVYLNSWVNEGSKPYIYLKDVQRETNHPLNGLIEAFTGSLSSGNLEFKKGKLKLDKKKGAEIIKLHTKLVGMGFNKTKSLFNALVRFTIKNPELSHKDIINNIKEVVEFKHVKGRDAYIGMLEYHCVSK